MSKSNSGMRKSKRHRKSKRRKRTSKIKRKGKWTMDIRIETKSK